MPARQTESWEDLALQRVRDAHVERMQKALLPVQSACQAVKAAHEKRDAEAAVVALAELAMAEDWFEEAARELARAGALEQVVEAMGDSSVAIVEALLDAEALVNAQNKRGKTALHLVQSTSMARLSSFPLPSGCATDVHAIAPSSSASSIARRVERTRISSADARPAWRPFTPLSPGEVYPPGLPHPQPLTKPFHRL